jgi:hypothetical protein
MKRQILKDSVESLQIIKKVLTSREPTALEKSNTNIARISLYVSVISAIIAILSVKYIVDSPDKGQIDRLLSKAAIILTKDSVLVEKSGIQIDRLSDLNTTLTDELKTLKGMSEREQLATYIQNRKDANSLFINSRKMMLEFGRLISIDEPRAQERRDSTFQNYIMLVDAIIDNPLVFHDSSLYNLVNSNRNKAYYFLQMYPSMVEVVNNPSMSPTAIKKWEKTMSDYYFGAYFSIVQNNAKIFERSKIINDRYHNISN